jgi:ketosteroid isomerase-like protein
MVVSPTAETEDRQQIETNLRHLYDAWSRRDDAATRALFSHRNDLVLWGSDQFERIVGRAEADREFASWLATCPPWTSIAPTSRTMGLRDGLAWVADEVEGRWVRDGESGTVAYRVTSIWEESDDAWELIHANVTIPH